MSDTLINLTDAALVSEEELLVRAREGDRSAFGTLYLRHRDAARKVAGMCASSSADAEDAVAEGFARVFAALPRMAGRTIAFRPYLLTCVRNAATDRLRRERRIDLRESLPETPAGLQADDVALLGLERNLVGEALQALPARWRTVLWLTEVEGLSPAEVSSRIGIKPNAVAALAYRARKGLREAYLQAHLRAEASVECRSTVARLGNYVRGELPERDKLTVQAHLDQCAKCRCRRDELTDVNATLRNAFLPVPLLLAGVRNRLFDFGQTGTSHWLSKAPEISQAAQMADSPFMHKALAGLSMVALAISGAAVPDLVESHHSAPEVAMGMPAATSSLAQQALRQVGVRPVLDASTTAGRAAATTASGRAAASGAPAASASSDPNIPGGSRSRLFGWMGNNPSEGPDRPGGTRHTLIGPSDPGSSSGLGALLGTAPLSSLIGVLDSALTTLGDLPLPVHLGVSAPALPGTAAVGVPVGLGLSVGSPAAKPVVGLDINLGALTGQSKGPAVATMTTAGAPAAAPAGQPEVAGTGPADQPAGAVLDTLGTDVSTAVSGLLKPVTDVLAGL
jgi:RNA polymerase sigma factor (sigma-70 family)